jgi:hypothetical protein
MDTALIFKCHRASVGHKLYITDNLYIFCLIFTRNNIQLRPSYKVNIHNYQIEKELFPEDRVSVTLTFRLSLQRAVFSC